MRTVERPDSEDTTIDWSAPPNTWGVPHKEEKLKEIKQHLQTLGIEGANLLPHESYCADGPNTLIVIFTPEQVKELVTKFQAGAPNRKGD